jgi:hypothetical protein
MPGRRFQRVQGNGFRGCQKVNLQCELGLLLWSHCNNGGCAGDAVFRKSIALERVSSLLVAAKNVEGCESSRTQKLLQ